MVKIRNLKPEDCGTVVEMIAELAAVEKPGEAVTATAADLYNAVFGEKLINCYICEVDDKAAGYMLYGFGVSSTTCRKSIHINDIYIRPEFRGQNLALGMVQNLAYLAMEWGCSHIDWSCLDTNTDAQEFFKSFGSFGKHNRLVYTLDSKDFLSVCSCKCHGGR